MTRAFIVPRVTLRGFPGGRVMTTGPRSSKGSWWVLVVPLGLLILVALLMHTFGVVPD